MLDILTSGNWSASHVRLRTVRSGRKIVPIVEAAIESAWSSAIAQPGVKLFDGPMLRLESWTIDGDALLLDVSQTCYRIFLGTNMTNPGFARQFSRAVMANPVGVSPALLSADRQLLLGRRNKSVAYYPERVHPFSGSMETTDANVFQTVQRELREELGLAADDIESIRCIGIVEDKSLLQPEIIFSVSSRLNRREIEARLDLVEHRAIYAIDGTAAGVNAALHDGQLTPVAFGSLLLWGGMNLGQEWFDAARNA